VTYSVEYRDSHGYHVGTKPWDEPFNLQQARTTALHLQTAIFKVTTVLSTNLPPDAYRSRYDHESFKKRDLLSEPDINMTVQTTTLKVFSFAIIQALRDIVSYYPDVSLSGDTVLFEAPYCPLVHHLDELEEYRAKHSQTPSPSRHASTADSAVLPTTSNVDDEPAETVDRGSRHIGRLLEYLNTTYGNRINSEKERHKRGLCTFSLVWILLKPGTTVYVRSGGKLLAHVVRSVNVDPSIVEANGHAGAHIKVDVWCLDFDGRKVGRRSSTEYISHFDGEQAIKSLNIFPCQFFDKEDVGKHRAQLIEEGKRWFGLLKGGMVHYDGLFLDGNGVKFSGRVFVDSASYWDSEDTGKRPIIGHVDDPSEEIHHAGCTCYDCEKLRDARFQQRQQHSRSQVWKDYDDIEVEGTLQLETENPKFGVETNHRYLICTHALGAFVLKTRMWAQVDVSNCSDAKTNTMAIDNLVMSKQRKNMIKALVQKHRAGDAENPMPKAWGADFIQNKGEGQIFLLHGGPGVGKSYVKCIAEYTGRPLLSLTVSDVGTEETLMERQLSKWFMLAEKWAAVMLIDEADVYLEKRAAGHIKRNGLVSVFLRCVEYFKGVLFLTTNRVGKFDDAFTSRIHVIIHYPPLRAEDRREIWEGFFAKLRKERPEIKVSRRTKEYVLNDEEMTKTDWNGREIRNGKSCNAERGIHVVYFRAAFQTAVSLALYQFYMRENKEEDENPELEQDHFEDICRMTIEFKKYLANIEGGKSEAYRAADLKERNDVEDSE
ncbi:hypothetical protein GE09DRAFT_1235499, partial [Coniochaeta sp. 2T2.1]